MYSRRVINEINKYIRTYIKNVLPETGSYSDIMGTHFNAMLL